MIKSMTGYGTARGFSGSLEISIEIKSVNSRYLECSIRIPRIYISMEDALKSIVGKYLSRGKIDVFVAIDSSKAKDVDITVNSHLAEAYISTLRKLANDYGLSDKFSVIEIARFPDVLQAEKIEADHVQLASDLCALLEEALDSFNEMRQNEGAMLYRDIKSRLGEIERLTMEAEKLSPISVEEYKNRLEGKLRDFLQSSDVDERRLLTEVAIFADRVAINEEIVRLKSHIEQLHNLLEVDEPVGRKIDFLLQEFNREANTIGSKGNDAQMAKVTVDLKAEIEKVREQAQNIE